jgi:predicted dehydrogenase
MQRVDANINYHHTTGFYQLKILFIGLGSIGQRHLRMIRKTRGEQDDIIAFRSRKTGSEIVLDDNMNVLESRSLTQHYNIKEFERLEDALGQQPELAFITNPTSLHVTTAIKAAQAGCHLFIEKALSDSEEGIDELIRVVDEKKLVALVGYQQKFHPGLIQIKKWLNKGSIGNIVSARFENGEYLPGWHPYEDYRKSFAATKELGGGVLFGMNHELDYIIHFFGMPDQVFATGGNLSELEVELEDTAQVISMFNSMKGTLPITVTFDYLQSPPVKGGLIVGDKGKITWDYINNRAALIDRASKKEVEVWNDNQYQRNQMFISQLNHLFECVAQGKQPATTIESARQSIKIALAARTSMDSKKIIDL